MLRANWGIAVKSSMGASRNSGGNPRHYNADMDSVSEPAAATRVAPSPEQVLAWIAASGSAPWFPARHASTAGIPREALDAPLNELRSAELVRVIDWVRGLGQGYAITPEGTLALTKRPDPAPPPEPLPVPAEKAATVPLDLRPPVVTPALLLANLLWYFVGLVVATRLGASLGTYVLKGDGTTLERIGAISALDLVRGEWWRLGTSAFVHFAIWHLAVNLFNLAMVGALAELLWGRSRVLLIYLVSGIAGSSLAMAFRPLDAAGGAPMLVGASGAIWGLATAVLAWIALHHRRLQRDHVVVLTRRLGFGFILGIAVSLLPGVSWEAHLGGAVAGFTLAVFLNGVRPGSPVRCTVAVLLASLMPAACLAGLYWSMQHGPAWAPFRTVPPLPDPDPFLHDIQPEAANPAIADAAYLLMVTPAKRTPERIGEARSRIAALWSNSVEALKRLEAHVDDPALEARRGGQRAFAESRREEMSRLLLMLDAKEIPSVEAWRSWGESRRESHRLWGRIRPSLRRTD
jgi:membrane associated rhomboid family serine protease